MADIQITKIIMLRGESADLPHKLDSGELAFSTDEGRLFIGCDPTSGQPQFDRSVFPFQNIEVLTENTTELFAKMHGDRMRNGGGADYYDARLEANTSSWASVSVARSSEVVEYRIPNITSVTAFIDYAVADNDGISIRMGNMHLTHFGANPAEPILTDNGIIRRAMELTDSENYESLQVFGTVVFRFKVSGPINAPYLSFQYKNTSRKVLNLRFKVSRPDYNPYDFVQVDET